MTAAHAPAVTLPAAPDTDDRIERRAPLLLRIGIFLAFAGVAVLEPGGPVNTAFVDVVFVGLIAYAAFSVVKTGSWATWTFAKASPWLWLILVGSLLGLAHVGLAGWALISLSRTAFVLAAFFAVWHLIEVARVERTALRGAVAALAIDVIGLTVVVYKYRASAFFPNPNYAGHFGVIMAALVMAVHPSKAVKLFAAACLGATLWLSASFGAIAMTLAMAAVVLVRSVRRSTGVLIAVLTVLVIVGGLFIISPGAEVESSREEWEVSSVISQRRFDRSSGSRFKIWSASFEGFAENPLGLGPNGVRYREVYVGSNGQPVEVHSDVVGFLVERGVIGLIGLIGFAATLWRSAPKRGVARMLMVGILAQALFRETIHYRHMWVAVALALVYDRLRLRSSPTPESSPDDDGTETPPRSPVLT